MRIRTAIDALRFAAYLQFGASRPARRDTIGLDERLAAIPVNGAPVDRPVTIRWNAHQVPFIDAENEHDLAAALGIVHAHLRLGQMEVLRRVSAGRLSEMVGPVALGLDHTLRIFDFGRALPAILRRLPDSTHEWLAAFAEGVNHVLFTAPLPHEFVLFDLKREPWDVAEVVRLGRLVALDPLWFVWLRLLRIRRSPEWNRLWTKLIGAGAFKIPDPSGVSLAETAALDALLGANNRSGSNALAVAAQRSASGSAWIAGDPHLGLSLPNSWLIAGYRCPTQEAVGLMIPGVPFMAIGRNRYIAWGGTNLHAHMSELCNASAIPTSSWETREEIVTPRWSRPRRFKIRSCALGPILSDSEFYDLAGAPLALRWVGHQASDEYTAMLAVGRARNWNEFRSALADFAVPGLNMIYADTEGNAGHALAAWIPKETPAAPQDVINHDAQRSWSGFFNATELPARFKPDCGFVVSANDRPDSDVVVGHLFSSRDRVERMTQLLNVGAVGRGALAALQADVQVDAAQKLARRLAGAARSGRSSRPTTKCERVLKELETWDGGYTADSRGAAAFELMLHAFARAFHTPESLAAYDVSWAMRDLIRADVEDGEPAKVAAAAQRALRWTSRRLGSRSWGDLHRLKLNHPLAAIPLAGRCYRFFDLPSAGGSDTLMKAANGLAKGRHAVRYGANARHISDLSDADKNDFVILGGQDGWFGSTTFADQVPLWRRNAYIQMPLRVETVTRMFPHVTTLVPRKRSGT